MAKKLIGILKVCLLVFSLLLFSNFSMSAKAEEVFNLEKDGFWAPADSVTHSFTVENIWGQECYFDYLKFSGSYIKNTATGEEFTLEEAKEKGIIQGYDVVIKLDDSTYGKEVIYNGKLMDLADERILLKKDIFMKLDTVVNFSINISFDAMSGNKYQDMQYVYIFYPHAYKINPTPTDPSESNPGNNNGGYEEGGGNTRVPVKTGDQNYYSMTILAIIMVISLEIMFLSTGRRIKEDYTSFFKMRGDT